MYNNEFKNELKSIYNGIKNIDNEFINIKIAIHNLEKLGLDTKEFYKLLDNVGILVCCEKSYFINEKQYLNTLLLILVTLLGIITLSNE